ncbi:hypothetical protein IWX49DRAFT_569441 [Phyllosticta citricarpa]|uniref:Transmembrane protein n=2 Tax=Phyllosticta TaxID=121621 RepID=A0ABR1MPA2_9PEZI
MPILQLQQQQQQQQQRLSRSDGKFCLARCGLGCTYIYFVPIVYVWIALIRLGGGLSFSAWPARRHVVNTRRKDTCRQRLLYIFSFQFDLLTSLCRVRAFCTTFWRTFKEVLQELRSGLTHLAPPDVVFKGSRVPDDASSSTRELSSLDPDPSSMRVDSSECSSFQSFQSFSSLSSDLLIQALPVSVAFPYLTSALFSVVSRSAPFQLS